MKTFVLVAGARPNFMKIAPLLHAMDRDPRGLRAHLVHTGQHYDAGMSDVFFQQLGIRAPDVYLGVGSGSHGAQTAKVLAAFEELLEGHVPRPCGVVVVGDVNSTMAAALAAVKLQLPVAHVEAGLRSGDRTMPEEINRLVTDAISELLLVSEPAGEANLRAEGIPSHRVVYVGNVMIDTLARELPAARALGMPAGLGLADAPFALLTLHRPSNVDDPSRLSELVDFITSLTRDLAVVFPAHPRTRARLDEFGFTDRLRALGRVQLAAPLGYRENLSLMAAARVVVTDSGGIQEETSFLGVPCLTLRPNTERPVTVELGTNTVVGHDLVLARALVDDVLAGRYKRGGPIRGWDGHAAERVIAALAERWS
ncbi:MAG: UDP-N-acetylglucosamine 2-epimerase (non-hydrolyzing) [Deltaproteobacteria bacterium]|nr:UDP-N-acetylglucosamine 2-epimerase (non-hydrolyzing) [Deltaproteobacteria bacterium]